MGLPLITYLPTGSPAQAKTVDFNEHPSTIEPTQPVDSNIHNWNYDHTALETLVMPQTGLMRFDWPALVDNGNRHLALQLEIEQWKIWAQRGGEWSFARDRADAFSTTTDGAVVAGDTVIPLTATTGIVVGRQYVIRTPTIIDIVSVASISAGVSVTLASSVNYAFQTGALFRSKLYWPKAFLVSATLRDLMQRHPYYAFSLEFEEHLQ